MKKFIGIALFSIWVMLFMLMLVEPSDDTFYWSDENLNGGWVGYTYVLLVLGLPFVWTRDYWWK
jgi:hypothetical protein